MSYEIPQKLQYEEKIIFGLTFKQLVYALIFLMPALFICMKTNWHIAIKGTIATLLIAIACLFMFFDFQSYLKNIFIWFKFREAFFMDKKMKEFIGVTKVENGVIYARK